MWYVYVLQSQQKRFNKWGKARTEWILYGF